MKLEVSWSIMTIFYGKYSTYIRQACKFKISFQLIYGLLAICLKRNVLFSLIDRGFVYNILTESVTRASSVKYLRGSS
jgi:hypothetical protein